MANSGDTDSEFSAAQLKALNDAIASGVLSVEYNGRRVTYQSMDNLIKARNLLQNKLSGSSGSGLFGGKRIVATTSKGLDD